MENYIQNFSGDIVIDGGITSKTSANETAYSNYNRLFLTLSKAGIYRFIACSGTITITNAEAEVHLTNCAELQIINSVGAVISTVVEKVGDTVTGPLTINSPNGLKVISTGSPLDGGLVIDNGGILIDNGNAKSAMVTLGKNDEINSKIIMKNADGSLRISRPQELNTKGLGLDNMLTNNGLTWNGNIVLHKGNEFPKLIFHGKDDFSVPITRSGQIYAACYEDFYAININGVPAFGALIFTTNFLGKQFGIRMFVGDNSDNVNVKSVNSASSINFSCSANSYYVAQLS